MYQQHLVHGNLDQTKGKYIDQVIRPTGLIDPTVEIRPAKNQVDDLMHECKEVVKIIIEY